MKQLEVISLSMLKKLEVNTNVQLFATQWVSENGIDTLEDMFSLFDRLNLPYVLIPNLKEMPDHKLIIAVTGDTEITIGQLSGGKFKASESDTIQGNTNAAKFYIVIEGAPLEKHVADWVGGRLNAFRPIIPKLLLISFITNLFALSIPFITMSIYDHVIGGDAAHELQGIAIGAALLFMMMGWLRIIRSQVFATVSNRVSREVSQALIQKLLHNTYEQNQQAAYSSQQNQLLLSERVSGVLSGPLGNALFDLPFILLFVIAIGVLAGWLDGISAHLFTGTLLFDSEAFSKC